MWGHISHQGRSERGDSLVMVALSLVMLLAMLALAIDVGLAYSERRKMQNAADAGALAGAWVLVDGGTDAEIAAAIQEYTVGQNQADTFQAYYLPSYHEVGGGYTPPDATGIQVIASVSFPTFLGGLLGIDTISASGIAGGGFSPLDIILVLDRSGSMDDDSCSLQPYPDSCPRPINQSNCIKCGGTWSTPPQPISDAKAAAEAFVDMNNPNLSHLGVVSYASDYTLDQPLTDEFYWVKSAIRSLTASGCTNAAGGLHVARNELTGPRARPDALRFIIFLTDGLPNKGLTSSQSCKYCPDYCPVAKDAARQEAAAAAADRIVIYTIALGNKADRALMQDIANLTGGTSYYAPSSSELLAIYREIFEQIRLRLIQ
ncbi:MAG TPA: VWA domain-containing protein [Caldilineae bacterium]|nr:VWA domain-containing protein [Caldilineae bacterium]